MKTSVIKCSVLFLVVFLLSIGNSALALDKTSVNLIKSYKEALSANNPEAIRKAFEALKANTEAVTYMNKNLPNLYERYEQSKALAASEKAKLAKGQQPGARSNLGSEPPAKTKIDPDPVRKAVREARDAVRGGESPAKTKIDPGAPPRRVSGDPELAELAKPGQRAVQGPKGDPDLADLVKGKGGAQPSSSSPKTKYTGDTKLSGDPGKTRLSGSGADTKYTGDTKLSGDPGKTRVSGQPKQNIGSRRVSGDPDLAKLVKPGQRAVQGTKGDPDLAKLAKGQQPGARSNLGSEPPAKTKIDPDPVRKAVREARDAVRGGESPAKTKIDPGAPPRRVSGDPELAELAKPGQRAVQGPKGDPDLAKLAKGQQPGARSNLGSEPPAKTKIDPRVPKTKAGAKVGVGAGEGGRPSIQDILNRNRGVVDPKKAGVEMPGRVPQDKLPPRRVSGDPELAELAKPGQRAVQGPKGDPELAKLGKESGRPGSAEPATTKITPKENVRPRRVSGDPELAELAKPGQRAVQGPKGDPDLAKLARGPQPQPRTNFGGKTPRAASVQGGASSSTYTGKPTIKQGASRAVGATMAAGIVSHGTQQERIAAAEEGRDFDPIRAGVETGRTLVGGDIYDAASQIAKEERQKEIEAAQTEGRAPDFSAAAARARRRVKTEGVLDPAAWGKSMGDRIGREEAQREIERAKAAGEAPSATRANIESARRVVGEMTGMQSIYDNAMYDSAADRAAAEMGRRIEGRRQDAILGMDDGLNEIARIQQRMRDLDKNPNQDDPWVKQRREALLDAYTAKRGELQRTNEALGDEAGAGDGEFIAIRGAVALIPEKPDYRRDEGEQIEEVADAILRDPDMEGETEEVADAILRDPGKEIDDLARAMVDNQVTPEEQAQWQDQGASDPNSLAGVAVRGFTGTNPAGYTDTERDMHASTRVTWTPDEVKKKDIEEERRTAEEQERQANAQRANQQRIDEERFTNDWSSTIGAINESLSELNEQDAQKVKDMTEAAIELIKQMQNGTLSDEDFTSQMAVLDNEHTNLQREGLEGWQRIRDRLIGDQVTPGGGSGNIPVGGNEADPCINDFTMNNNSELSCKCQGYTFDYSMARCVKTGGGSGTANAGGTGGTPGSGDICPCVDENGRRYRVMFGQDCSMDLGMAGRDYDCSDDTIGGGGSATATGGSGGGATGRQGMMYRIQTPPYGGGDVCLTAEEAEGIRNAPNTVLFEPLGEPCFK